MAYFIHDLRMSFRIRERQSVCHDRSSAIHRSVRCQPPETPPRMKRVKAIPKARLMTTNKENKRKIPGQDTVCRVA
jgi:hypothetical protein